ncbi:MAG: putative TetR family transcriptional regulator [Ilumatobacteraceae bacterium]|nr:putative TetR family transcriptional regulator [Ilumatobacteraceae bacterium]
MSRTAAALETDTSSTNINGNGPAAPARRGRPRDVRCDHAILQATLEILSEGGAGNLSIDGVAARAGVGKATIYRRWSSKEALLLEALGTDATTLESPDTGTLRGDLEAYFGGLLDRLASNPNSDLLPHLIEAACYDAEVRKSLDEYLSSRQTPLRSVLQRAQQRGELATDLDLKVVVDVLVGPVMYRRLMTGERLDRTFVRKHLDIVLTGLLR